MNNSSQIQQGRHHQRHSQNALRTLSFNVPLPGAFVQIVGDFLPKGARRFGMIKIASGLNFVVALPMEDRDSVALVNVHGTRNLRPATVKDVVSQ
jgi:hypothetical protein